MQYPLSGNTNGVPILSFFIDPCIHNIIAADHLLPGNGKCFTEAYFLLFQDVVTQIRLDNLLYSVIQRNVLSARSTIFNGESKNMNRTLMIMTLCTI